MKISSKFTLILLLILQITSFATAKGKQQNENSPFALIDKQEYWFVCYSMTNEDGLHETLTTFYKIMVDSGRTKGYLPHRGKIFNTKEFELNTPIDFNNTADDYQVSDIKKLCKKKCKKTITWKTDGTMETYAFHLEIDNEGEGILTIEPENRQKISYLGKIYKINPLCGQK